MQIKNRRISENFKNKDQKTQTHIIIQIASYLCGKPIIKFKKQNDQWYLIDNKEM